MSNLHILCYNGSLAIWTVVSLATAKFKPIIFSSFGFILSYTANMIIVMIWLAELGVSTAPYIESYFVSIEVHLSQIRCQRRSRNEFQLANAT
jgi:hypothetical protein